MNAFLKTMMKLDRLSCKKATFLAVKKQESGISTIEQIQLWYHYKLCYVCQVWENQSELLSKLIKKSLSQMPIHMLSQQDKEEIKAKISS